VPLTQEHLWSDWIGQLFIGQEFGWRSIDPETSQTTGGKMKSFDRKVEAVCAECNNVWMSDLETAVQPLLSGIIRDGASMYFTHRDVTKLADFTFKNAVIANYVNPEREPFFTRAAREQFRATRQIPPGVHMWIAALSASTTTGAFWGYVVSPHQTAHNSVWHDLEVYVFTFAIGYLVLQLRAFRYGNLLNRGKKVPVTSIQSEFWDDFAIPFWPARVAFGWPPKQYLNDWFAPVTDSLFGFARRWEGPIRFSK
jgi:hypothetical protein